MRTKLSENSKMFLIGQWEKELYRQMVKMPRTFQNHQSIAGCSKFFNLKPNAGTKTNFSTSTQKSKRFFGVKKQHSEHKGARSFQKKKQNKKVYDKCIAEYSFFKWEISLVHYKRGYSGPGMPGEFVVVLLMWFLGAPSILIFMLLFIHRILYEYFKEIFVNEYICTLS